MNKILVTGGLGFIGSHLVKLLNNETSLIINIDSLTYAGNTKNLKGINHNNYAWYYGSISDRLAVEQVFNDFKFDYVINVAAETHVDNSIEDPDIFVETNVLGTQILLDAAMRHKVKKFIQVSTDEVYGSLGPTGSFTESSPIDPRSPYSASKASADMMVQAYYHTYGLPTMITRCSNNYGPNQHHEKLIPASISRLIKNEPLNIYGTGLNVRDWIHVKDHCQAIKTVLELGKSGEVYNVGSNNEKTNLEIAGLIVNEMKGFKYPGFIHFVEDRKGHDFRYAIDSSKIRSQLGWKPKYDFETGISDTIRWYKDNPEWLKA